MLRAHRVPGLAPNRLWDARQLLQRQGVQLLDLTESNPTRAGFAWPEGLLAPLGGPAGLAYAPDPRGLATARDAVAGELRRHGATVDPHQIVLTASTSEAYSFLFKVLCDPEDEVLVPAPSYPLFEILGRLEAVRVLPYPLDPHGGWGYDAAAIAARVTPRTRAVIAVSPNNPTGSVLTSRDVAEVSEVCATHALVLIADEVFADYRFGGANGPACVLAEATCLAVSLGGLSKAVGLPQLKLAWMAVSGPEGHRSELIAALELVADSFLSVGTPVQAALPHLLDRGDAVRRQIRDRLSENLDVLRRRLAGVPSVQLLDPSGGWTAVLRVPATRSEESLALDLLERHHVIVQPGYFYDFPFEAWLVISLLVEPSSFALGLERIVAATSAESDKMSQGSR